MIRIWAMSDLKIVLITWPIALVASYVIRAVKRRRIAARKGR